MKKLLMGFFALSFFTGCAPVISQNLLDQVDPHITFADLKNDPVAQKGKTILLGGVIVRTTAEREGTLLEIYQTELDRSGEPVFLDRSKGRFLAYYQGFLDSAIWQKGRKVTVAGTVEGEKTGRVGDMLYHYPYLRVREIHLWEDSNYPSYHDPWYPWGPPWWGWDPWWDPFRYPYWAPYPRFRHRHR